MTSLILVAHSLTAGPPTFTITTFHSYTPTRSYSTGGKYKSYESAKIVVVVYRVNVIRQELFIEVNEYS